MYPIRPIVQSIRTLSLGIVLSFIIITIRLFYLQITHSDIYVTRGKRNFLRIENTQSQRGNILDRNGNILVTNIPVTHLYWQGSGNRPLSQAQLEKIHLLESITMIPFYSNPSCIAQLNTIERQYKKAKLASDISLEQLSKIQELFPDDPNMYIATHFKRHYPQGMCASHILGYLGKMDAQFYGKMGLEKLCENILKGEDGTILKTINSVGRDMAMVKLKESAPGAPIQTTIDLPIQQMCEEIFPKEYAGAILVMDPKDGSIIASTSYPTFDPALFLAPIDHEQWKTLQEKQPFMNRALNTYPPGSIFKLVTVSALMETHMLDPDDVWNCIGFVTFADRRYWCNNKLGHGKLNSTQAVAQSCNTPFFELGKRMDIDLIHEYASKFGLGQSTGFIFPEHTGIVPSREWKRRTRGERWWPGETLSVSIGQSFLLASPLQVARMIGSIFTGYLVKPRILMSEEIEKTPLHLKQRTLDFLKESMKFVVSRGTGRRLSSVKDIEIYAKTSTAQTSDLQKRTLGTEYLEHAWFVAHFQYRTYDPLVFVILVENAGSSSVSTAIAKNFLIAYKELKNPKREATPIEIDLDSQHGALTAQPEALELPLHENVQAVTQNVLESSPLT